MQGTQKAAPLISSVINGDIIPMENKVYVVDTTGTWMLDALFKKELRRLEPRAFEYLVHFIKPLGQVDST